MGVGAQNSLGGGETTFARKTLRQLLNQMHNLLRQLTCKQAIRQKYKSALLPFPISPKCCLDTTFSN